jgi:FG-GAP-like repeat/FG-GAP repeat
MQFALVRVTVAGLVCAWTALGQPARVTFAVPPQFSTGVSSINGVGTGGPFPALSVNLNNDGYDDIVTVDPQTGALVVVLGGSQGFQAPMSFTAVQYPTAIAAGDFNNDGKLDVVVAGSSVALLLGTGTGSFQPPITLSSSSARTVAAGDFNGDGNLDLAIGGYSNEVLVALGNGDGAFGSFVSSPTPQPWAVYPGKFHNNGLTDLILVEMRSLHVYLLTSNGDGTFQQSSPIVRGAWGVAIADMNGDGNQDFVTIDAGEPVRVWLGDGKGDFTIKWQAATEAYPYYVAIADVNGDGIPDVVTATSDGSVSVLLGNGDGTLQKSYSYIGTFPQWVGVGSFFGSDHADIATLGAGNYLSGVVISLLRNRGSGNFGLRNIILQDAGASFALADMNQDGIPDVVAPNGGYVSGATPAVWILPGLGDGEFGNPIATVPLPSFGSSPVVADFNGDGKPDFAIISGPGSISVALQQANTTYQVVTSPAPGTPTYIWAADLNGDGLPDLIALSGGGVYVLLNAGQGAFQNAAQGLVPFAVQHLAIADFNNDGKPDLAIATYGTSIQGPAILIGNGDGTFQLPVYLGGSANLDLITTGDLDHDGNQDIAADANGTLLVYLGNGNGGFQRIPNQSFQNSPGQVLVADLNGDGFADLVVTQFYYTPLQIYLGEGNGLFHLEPFTYYAPGGTFMDVQLGDINNDGKMDLVCLSGVFSMFLNTSR